MYLLVCQQFHFYEFTTRQYFSPFKHFKDIKLFDERKMLNNGELFKVWSYLAIIKNDIGDIYRKYVHNN